MRNGQDSITCAHLTLEQTDAVKLIRGRRERYIDHVNRTGRPLSGIVSAKRRALARRSLAGALFRWRIQHFSILLTCLRSVMCCLELGSGCTWSPRLVCSNHKMQHRASHVLLARMSRALLASEGQILAGFQRRLPDSARVHNVPTLMEQTMPRREIEHGPAIAPGIFVALLEPDGELVFGRLVDELRTNIEYDGIVFISRMSPLGAALIDRRAGDIVVVKAPLGSREIEVLGVGEECRAGIQEAWQAEAGGDVYHAAVLLESCVSYASAARRYVLAGAPAGAARCCEHVGLWRDAARLHEVACDWLSAGRCWREGGEWLAAAVALEKANAHTDAGRMFERAERWEQAVAQYRLCADQSAIGRCLQRAGDFAGAAQAYREAGEHQSAAVCHSHAGDGEAAAADRRFAELLTKAARNYEACADWAQAADSYRKSGIHLDAARCYELAGCMERAAACFELAECPDDSLRCQAIVCENRGEYVQAAELFEQAAGCAWWGGAPSHLAARAAACRRSAAS